MFQRFAPRAGPRARNRIRRRDQHRFDGFGFHFAVMRRNHVAHIFRHAVFARIFRADDGVRAADFVRNRFANVMQQRAHLGALDIRLEFRRNHGCQM
ncbi:MAG: hypothetical protein HDKAJFGB_03147 [Anaerolineae bacterium]|nr:hypothetical protein [Anaerolineae bacterium]